MLHKKLLTAYLQKTIKKDAYVFIGNHASAYIPQRYEVNDLLTLGQTVRTLGIFEMTVDGESIPFEVVFPAIITMCPSDVRQQKINEIAYYVLTFKKGDIFMSSLTIMKQDFVIAKMFIEFYRNGHMPAFLGYDQMATLFDVAQYTCGVTLPVPHATWEMMNAHCCRDPDNLGIKYRFTDKKKKPAFLGLRNMTDIRDSTSSKLLGPYMMDAINSSIVNQNDQMSEVENLLRQ